MTRESMANIMNYGEAVPIIEEQEEHTPVPKKDFRPPPVKMRVIF
tara:strand:- start:530 stop:664 length:135 start_codon:yes stop_codon:yes gene_type:complete